MRTRALACFGRSNRVNPTISHELDTQRSGRGARNGEARTSPTQRLCVPPPPNNNKPFQPPLLCAHHANRAHPGAATKGSSATSAPTSSTQKPARTFPWRLISESGWSDEEETRQQRKRQTKKLSLKRKAGASGQKRSRRGTSSTPARSPAKAGTPKKKAASELPFAVGSSVWVEYGKVSYAAQVVDYDAAEGEYRVRYDNARNSDEWVQSDMVKHPDFFNTRRREKRAVKQYQS